MKKRNKKTNPLIRHTARIYCKFYKKPRQDGACFRKGKHKPASNKQRLLKECVCLANMCVEKQGKTIIELYKSQMLGSGAA